VTACLCSAPVTVYNCDSVTVISSLVIVIIMIIIIIIMQFAPVLCVGDR